MAPFLMEVPPPGEAECRDRQISENDPKKGTSVPLCVRDADSRQTGSGFTLGNPCRHLPQGLTGLYSLYNIGVCPNKGKMSNHIPGASQSMRCCAQCSLDATLACVLGKMKQEVSASRTFIDTKKSYIITSGLNSLNHYRGRLSKH
jgi:hypothetical protein